MQTGLPPNLQNLNQIFQKYDSDYDGRVHDTQVEGILLQVGYKDIYLGTVRKVIRLLNFNDDQVKTLDFSQVQEFAQVMANPGKFGVWKAKYKLQSVIKQAQIKMFGKDQNEVAPGAGPGEAKGSNSQQKGSGNQQAQINLKTGNSQEYNQHVSLKIQKQKGNQIKPFVKISIQRKTTQEAQKIETIFKSIFETIIQIIKAEDEWLAAQILSVSFITNVQDSTFNLFITTNNQGLNEISELAADFYDLLLKQPITGNFQSAFHFNFEFDRFLAEPTYNFYDMIVKNSKFELKWNVWDLFNNLRSIFLKMDLLNDLGWNPHDYLGVSTICLLHIERFSGKVEFQNTGTQNQQTATKQKMAELLKDCRQQLKSLESEFEVNILELIEELDGKIRIEGGVRDWKLSLQADLSNFSKIFLEKMQGYN